MKIGNKCFDNNKTYVMGILNVTPDSFSDGGEHNTLDSALKHTERMIDEGADIIDVGGESTRPGHTTISANEEAQRVVPIIEAIKARFDIPVSIDTYKTSVADSALASGAELLNDISGLKADESIAKCAKAHGAAVCLTHNRTGKYNDFLNDVLSDLTRSIQIAKSAGIDDDKIIVDPGVGFAKTPEENLRIMNNLELLHSLGYPVLLGASRKSVIGLTLDLPTDERIEGTLATTVIARIKKVMFVRVHDVKENVRVLKMTDAILNAE